MFKLIKTAIKLPKNHLNIVQKRKFLSEAYYCKEVWDSRLNSPLLKKVNPDVLYYELDQRYQKTRQLSVVDVDIFANALKNDLFLDELLDIVHKLRLTAETAKTLPSTTHAYIRALLDHNRIEDLLSTLDDRLNYGIFLDGYTANILLDYFWKKKDFVSGCRVASQLMLQEDFEHPISQTLSVLHGYNYLLEPGEWPQPPKPEEPEEDVKIRVKYVRNEYFDNHFDLKEPLKIVGKTLALATKNENDPLSKSFTILGWTLFGDLEKAKKVLDSNKDSLIKEIVDLIPEEGKDLIKNIELKSENVNNILTERVKLLVNEHSEHDIAKQFKAFQTWENLRLQALEEQKQKVLREKRLSEVEELMKNLEEKETKLWFFENEEKIELTIEESAALEAEKPKEKTTKKVENADDYVPPEIVKKHPVK